MRDKPRRLLAFDASLEPGSVALLIAGTAVDELAARPGETSSQALLPAATALLAARDLRLADLDAIAFGCGPGAFTGLRVACGIVQGLAYGLRLPVVPIDSLAAVALRAIDAAPLEAVNVLVTMDARMGEVYCAHYRNESGMPRRVGEPQVLPPADVPLPVGISHCAGNALRAYPALAERLAAAGVVLLPDLLPAAGAIARLAAEDFAAGRTVSAMEATPVYVRDKVALTTRERLAAGGSA